MMIGLSDQVEIINIVASTTGDPGWYRVRVGGRHFKYLKIAGDAYPENLSVSLEHLAPLLPSFPPDDWTIGHISSGTDTNLPIFTAVKNEPLDSIQFTWHPRWVDYSELRLLKSNLGGGSNVFEVDGAPFGRDRAVLKMAVYPYEIDKFDYETDA
jgi:hypothetical protein